MADALRDNDRRATPVGVRRFVLAWFLADLALALLHVLNATLIAWLFRPTTILDLDAELNLATWYATIQLAAVAAGLACAAWIRAGGGERGAWRLLVPAAMALYLSFDEAAQLHERLSRLGQFQELGYTGSWPLFAGPLFLIGLVAAGVVTRGLWGDATIRNRVMLGAALYLIAAAGLELAQNFAAAGGLLHQALIFAEEMGELVGVTVVLWGVAELVSRAGLRVPR